MLGIPSGSDRHDHIFINYQTLTYYEKDLLFLFRTCIGWFLFGVLFLQSSYAQDSNSTNSIAMHAVLSDGYFKPQSPDVWSMIKYGNANIDYYTGTLGISIPIYTYKDNNFEIPISIDYASSGFQPGSPSGLVGQGWYLNFGGAITREVRGIPDDAIQEMYDWREKADQEMNEIPWWDEYTFPRPRVIYLRSFG